MRDGWLDGSTTGCFAAAAIIIIIIRHEVAFVGRFPPPALIIMFLGVWARDGLSRRKALLGERWKTRRTFFAGSDSGDRGMDVWIRLGCLVLDVAAAGFHLTFSPQLERKRVRGRRRFMEKNPLWSEPQRRQQEE